MNSTCILWKQSLENYDGSVSAKMKQIEKVGKKEKEGKKIQPTDSHKGLKSLLLRLGMSQRYSQLPLLFML